MGLGLNRDQLDALRRQIEEDYRLDMAAIERLQRRFVAPSSNAAPVSFAPVNGTMDSLGSTLDKVDSPRDQQSDELTGSIRAMFSGQRK